MVTRSRQNVTLYTYIACIVKHWFLLEKSVLVYVTVPLAVLAVFVRAYKSIKFAVCLNIVHKFYCLHHVNQWNTDWVPNVPRLGLLFDSSRWYKVTILPIFSFVL